MFLGGLVTSWQAGMAVPDWPLSFNSLNPTGWWANFPVRLEHSHRLTAETVGFLVAVLVSWVWRNRWALPAAIVMSAILPIIGKLFGAPKEILMHLAIWPAAAVFVGMLLFQARRDPAPRPSILRGLSLALFICVCIQAAFGGLRVTEETAGAINVALVFRIVHGSFAQIFVLSLGVALAALLSAAWSELRPPAPHSPKLHRLAWIVFAALILQLIFGATMRHMGAGLAIPKFPKASDTAWLPTVHSAAVDTNFTHTRVGALLVTVLIVVLSVRILRSPDRQRRLLRPARALLVLVAIQVILGVSVIQFQTPPLLGSVLKLLGRFVEPTSVFEATRGVIGTVKTVHMFNGAITLATTLLLALRLSRVASLAASSHVQSLGTGRLAEAAV